MDYPVQGAGLGLRRAFAGPLADQVPSPVTFLEVAPENWIDLGGKYGKQFQSLTERIPFVCHGLSLNLGGTAPLDEAFLGKVKGFLERFDIRCYSEHLSYCADAGHLYDLMPIPFTDEAVLHVAGRIKQVQEITGRRLAVENVSYYAAPGQEMTEIDFINNVLEEADCDLLLDINNIYVNSINHGYDAVDFLRSLPADRIAYGHIAGHYCEAEDLRIDTHGADIIEPVWGLLETAFQYFGVFPVLLERDFNIPPLPELIREVSMIDRYQSTYAGAEDDLTRNRYLA